MGAERKSIFNPNSEVLRPYSTKDPVTLGDMTPVQRWRLKSREAELQTRPTSADGAIQRMLDGGNIMWEILSPESVAQILQGAASELELPASMFRSTDLEQSLDMFGGRTLIGLLKYVTRHPEREGRPVMPFLMEQAGIEATGMDIAEAMRKKRQPEWGHTAERAISEVLELAAEELDKPVNMLKTEDFTRPLKILSGRSLKGLYNHYDVKPEREEQDTVNFIFSRLGVEIDVYAKMRALGSVTFFEQASWDEIGILLERVAEEMGKPISMITANDIRGYNVQFLGGRTLRELKQCMDKDNVPIHELSTKISAGVSVEDIIFTAKTGRSIIWNRVSVLVSRQLLSLAAEERGKPVALLTVDDLKGGFNFLDGKSLSGLHNYINKRRRPENTTVMPFLLEQMGIPVTAEDVIEGMKNGAVIMWDRVSWNEIGRLIEKVADELGILPEMVGSPELTQKFDFIGGSTLLGMYWYANKHREKNQDESTVTFLRRKLGIDDGLRPRRTSRLKYRAQKIDETLNTLMAGKDSISTIEGLLPSIHSIARLYVNPFLDVETSEIESEAVFFALDFIAQGHPTSEFSKGLNARLEQYVNTISKPRYREKLLSTPITEDGTRTLEDVLSVNRDIETDLEFGDTIVESFKVLSPVQQELVMKIAVDGRTMDEVSEELGIDIELLQEMYFDSLSTLRNQLT